MRIEKFVFFIFMIGLSISASSQVAYWSFDNAQGLVIPDDSGNGNHSKFISWGIPIEKGKIGEALHIFRVCL